MAKSRRKHRRKARKGVGPSVGTLALLALLAAGGWAVWTLWPPAARETAPPPLTAEAPEAAEREDAGPAAPPVDDRFQFYDVLPDAEVPVLPEAHEQADPRMPPVVVPGAYVVQAGAFPDFSEADKVKARLALLGVVSVIQPVETGSGLFHRVRIGPIEDLDRLNRLRAQLRANRIEFMVIPVGE